MPEAGGCSSASKTRTKLPPATQQIDDALVERLHKRIPQMTHNVQIAPRKTQAANGGEMIEVEVFPTPSVAATSDGRYFLRVGNECRRLLPDDLLRLMNDKAAFVWETQTSQQVPRTRFDADKQRSFLAMIRASERVSSFVKAKSDEEILAHYLFVRGGNLTNLGVLCVTPRNILHASVARNMHLAQVFRDLKLREKEGSGCGSVCNQARRWRLSSTSSHATSVIQRLRHD
jgi:ATP-dependent DNA helicase RecG